MPPGPLVHRCLLNLVEDHSCNLTFHRGSRNKVSQLTGLRIPLNQHNPTIRLQPNGNQRALLVH